MKPLHFTLELSVCVIAGAVSVDYQLQIEADFITQDDHPGSRSDLRHPPGKRLECRDKPTLTVGLAAHGPID